MLLKEKHHLHWSVTHEAVQQTDTGEAFSLAFVIDFEVQAVYHQLVFILTSVQATSQDIWCLTINDQSCYTQIASAIILSMN